MNNGIKFMWIAALAILAACTTGNRAGYTAYDINSDNRLDRAEFTTAYGDLGYYNTWDTDRDNRIIESEWDAGINTNYPTYDMTRYGTFRDWDLDNDGFISDNEFNDANYRMWDTNMDGYIEVSEFNQWRY